MNRIKCEKCGEVIGHLITTCKCPYCFENSGVDLVEINEGLKAKVNELEKQKAGLKHSLLQTQEWRDVDKIIYMRDMEKKVIELESIIDKVKELVKNIDGVNLYIIKREINKHLDVLK